MLDITNGFRVNVRFHVTVVRSLNTFSEADYNLRVTHLCVSRLLSVEKRVCTRDRRKPLCACYPDTGW